MVEVHRLEEQVDVGEEDSEALHVGRARVD